MKKYLLLCVLVLATASCMHGNHIRDVDFPATPVDMTQLTKSGKACFKIVPGVATMGNGSIIQAAKNGGVKTVYMVEYSDEFEMGGFVHKRCTTVYGN